MTRKRENNRVQIHFPEDEGRTIQSESNETDINKIMGKYRHTGIMEHVNLKTPVYADFSNATDYRAALHALNQADEIFDSLPARVRARVDNDPAKLIAFVEDPENADELVELGLLNPVTDRSAEPAAASETTETTTETLGDA